MFVYICVCLCLSVSECLCVCMCVCVGLSVPTPGSLRQGCIIVMYEITCTLSRLVNIIFKESYYTNSMKKRPHEHMSLRA